MSDSNVNLGTKNTFQRVIEEEKSKIPSRYDVNRVLHTWESDDRFTYSFNGQQKNTYAFLVLLVCLYFIWIGQLLITVTIGSVFFLLYVLYTVPASRVTHSIEVAGIRTTNQLFLWEDMVNFWFADRENRIILCVDTRLNFPSRLIIIVDSFNEAVAIANVLIEKLPYRVLTQNQGYFEKLTDGKYLEPTEFINPIGGFDVVPMTPVRVESLIKNPKPRKINNNLVKDGNPQPQKSRNKKATA